MRWRNVSVTVWRLGTRGKQKPRTEMRRTQLDLLGFRCGERCFQCFVNETERRTERLRCTRSDRLCCSQSVDPTAARRIRASEPTTPLRQHSSTRTHTAAAARASARRSRNEPRAYRVVFCPAVRVCWPDRRSRARVWVHRDAAEATLRAHTHTPTGRRKAQAERRSPPKTMETRLRVATSRSRST